jgi:hypothetical protein
VRTELGWFTLELCYGKTIRQFHEVRPHTLIPQFVLPAFR